MWNWMQAVTSMADASCLVMWRRRGLAGACMLIGAVLLATACTAKEDLVGLSGLPYNYDDRSIVSVRVNGRGVGGGMDAAERGGVKGGGQTCCFRLPRGARDAEVQIQYANGEVLDTTAVIEQPWPPLTSLGIIHVLPGLQGPKVIIEITPGQSFPRRDLMEEALDDASLERVVDYGGPLRDGPFEYMDD